MKTNRIELTTTEIDNLDAQYGYETINAAIAAIVREERDEEWEMLNDGLTDLKLIEGHASLINARAK